MEWALNPVAGIFQEKSRGRQDTQRQKEEGYIESEAENGVILP